MSTRTISVDAVLDAYIECALWSTNADHLDPEGTGAAGALEDHFSASDLAPEAMASIREDVESFLASEELRAALAFWASELGEEQIGHDFWLTRNGHGAGFWDRFYNGPGQTFGNRLTEATKPFGESYLYAGDDGRVYVA